MDDPLKTLLSIILILVGFAAQANTTPFTLQCEISEIHLRSQNVQKLELEVSDDPHGTVKTFNLEIFKQYSGMIALMNNNVVIHLYDEATGYAFTTHSDISGTGMAYYQLMPPARVPGQMDVVAVTCVKKLK